MTVNIRYEINLNEQFAIRFWDLDNPNPEGAPFMYQPDWPDGTAWASIEEAENWAKQYVAMREDKTNGAPGGSPKNPFIPYNPESDKALQKEEILQKALALGLTEEEINALK